MSRPIALVCVAVAGLSLSAHAERPKLVVLPFAPGEGATEKSSKAFGALVTQELKARGEVELVAPPTTRPLAAVEKPSEGRRGPSPEALSALDAGKKAFDDLRFEDAVAGLQKGIELMLQEPGTADYEGVTEAWVKLAAAAFRMGEEKAAKQALFDLARFSPTFTLPGGYPPVFEREFEKAKKRVAKQPTGQVSIEGPNGSTAYLDGRDLGMVPVLEENVPAGPHYVKVEGPKNERFGQVVDLKGGMVKVKASFGGGERGPVAKAQVVVDPSITSSVDEAAQARLLAYCKAAGADFALVGYVYRTSDTQLTAGTALFSAKRTAFGDLPAVSFDTEVLTANTEAFRLVDEVGKRLGSSLGTVLALPVSLVKKAAKAGTGAVVAKADPTDNPDEIDAAAPKKTVLIPRDPPPKRTEAPPLAEVEPPPPDLVKPGGDVKSGVPAWVWVVLGVGVAAGAGVGGYFAVTEITKPVTGTVTATW